MKGRTIRAVSVAALAARGGLAQSPDQFTPAGPGDVRAPCPMLNALANHNYLPHNGQNITQDMTTSALDKALNIPPEFGALLHSAAVRTNPDGNATNQFSLDMLARHNILEHDASLSRGDAFFGDNLAFNQTVFDETRSHWQDTIDVGQAAAARMARIQTSNSTNPTFGFTKVGKAFSIGETAAYLIVLGNKTTLTANKTVVEYLFQKERLPTEVGWSRSPEPLGAGDLAGAVAQLNNASSTTPAAAAPATAGAPDPRPQPLSARDFLVNDIHMAW